MTDNRTMAEMLRAPTEGCAEAIMVPSILAEQFELKHSLINMMTSDQFFGLEKDNPHDHIRCSEIAKLTHAVNQQTSVVTTAMTAMLKQLQATPPPAPFKAVEEIYVTCGAASNYNQGNPGYRPQGVANQMRPLGSGSLPGNTVANPKGELKAITTRSGLVIDGPTVPTPPKSVTLEEDECGEETYTDPDLAEYTIKVLPPPVQIHKPPKILKALLSNKEKLQELANTSLNENCSAVILKKLPEKLGDPGKILIPCGFSLPDLISTRMTLELANRAICMPDGIARDVFVPVGKFTFPADFVVVDNESDPRVPLILGRPFLRTARALIDVHGEEMILRDGDERLTLNMKHDTASYSNHRHRDSVNLINIFIVSSEDCLEDSVSNQKSGNPTFSLHKEITSPEVTHEIHDSQRDKSGNPTFSLHKEITSPEVTHEIHDSEGCNFLSEEFPYIDSFNDIDPYFNDNPLSGSTTYSSNSLLEELVKDKQENDKIGSNPNKNEKRGEARRSQK
nr:reverse transcriptase domain-containing protein [Tanacetum cinerariifolium]